MKSKLSLNEAVQVGPWRVARKHLLFVILFGLAIIAFGLIVIHSHVFNKRDNEEGNEEEDEEGEEEGDEEWGEIRSKFSGGDWVMIAIMAASGLLSLVAIFVCALVKKNTPRRLSSAAPQNTSPIYSVQFNSNAPKPPSTSSQPFSSAQTAVPVWSGQYIQQPQQQQQQIRLHVANSSQNQTSRTQQLRQPILTLPKVIGPQVKQTTRAPVTVSIKQGLSGSGQPKRKVGESSGPTAQQIQIENPPPYSP